MHAALLHPAPAIASMHLMVTGHWFKTKVNEVHAWKK
jgi:hypothetical protein